MEWEEYLDTWIEGGWSGLRGIGRGSGVRGDED